MNTHLIWHTSTPIHPTEPVVFLGFFFIDLSNFHADCKLPIYLGIWSFMHFDWYHVTAISFVIPDDKTMNVYTYLITLSSIIKIQLSIYLSIYIYIYISRMHQEKRVRKIVIHPDFKNNSLHNNFAILFLEQNVSWLIFGAECKLIGFRSRIHFDNF